MNKFFQQTLASFIGSLAGLFFFFLLTGSGLLIFLIALLLSDTTPQIKDQSVLVFNLNTQITDKKLDNTLEEFLAEEKTKNLTVREITKAIEKAAKDPKIVALFLDGKNGVLNSGYANLTEIKSALEKFKASGKKIISYDLNYSEKDYYITSIADTIILDPIGLIEINGFSSPQLFLANALQKYGIGVQVIRAGKFKAAVEPFIRNNYSEESRQQTQVLLKDLWTNYVNDVSKNRNLTTTKIKEIANTKGILNGEEAKQLGLIDKVADFNEVVSDLQTISNSKNEDSFRQISIKNYLDSSNNEQVSNNKIAILYAEGTIVGGKGKIGQIGSAYFAKQIRKIRDDDNIKAVIVRINSPGGSAIASEIILRELLLTKKKKPVIISMGNIAASGGYWIATSGEKIFAEKNTITGSIGVFGVLFNLEKIANNNGINYDVVKTGKFADLNAGFRAKTDAELQIYQKSVDAFYSLFLEKVAKARNLTTEKVDNIAQGRVWSGEDAKNVGLVDEIGGLNSAIQYTIKELKLGDDWEVKEYPEKRNWETEFLEKLEETKLQEKLNDSQIIAITLSKLKSELDIADIIENPNQIYTILPFKLEIE